MAGIHKRGNILRDKNAKVTVLIELDGIVCMVGMNEDDIKNVKELILNSVSSVIPTNRSDRELRYFLELNNTIKH